jgi:hypothetical protein
MDIQVGDKVKSIYGSGVVKEINQADASATIELESWLLAGGQKPTAYLHKGAYTKIM